MSTAQTPQPDDTAGPPGTVGTSDRAGDRTVPGPQGPPRTSSAPDRPPTPLTGPDRNAAPAPWPRRLQIGLVLGLLAWGLAALLSPEAGLPRQLAAAGLCAAAAVAVQYLLGPDRTAEERARRAENLLAETAATVRDGLRRHDDLRSDLVRYTEDVKQLAENLPVATDRSAGPQPARIPIEAVPDLATNFADVLAPGPPILSTFVRLEMQRVIGYMTDLTTLTVECPGENHDWMLALTRAAEESICATSTSVDREFWNSEPASRYLHAQQEAIDEHGVPVRRLFLLESARELDDRLLRLCEEQEVLHIEVRVAVLPELPPHLLRGTTNDFIVYDEAVSFEIDQDLRDVNIRTRLIARPDHVQDRMKRFRDLWEAGMSLRELEVRVDDEEDGTWMVDRG
ncbi:hypothetical protein ABZ918_01410 [Streptomyces viridosporus]|uniref:Uncharacterized protein n=1 Tax=Streptomyces viridosporus T7A TaxID=665577 RepID=A0ABX6AED9_STRVD|nr:hypothetical protein [Streptomyces viridosporus]QEU85651.1 hypothetical protein CP969_13710 [Streptomyces viridosporus T7A]